MRIYVAKSEAKRILNFFIFMKLFKFLMILHCRLQRG